MAAIKVVQIALAMGKDIDGAEERAEYLDDKGRVWYQESKLIYPAGSTSRADAHWESEWKQLELPEEPTA